MKKLAISLSLGAALFCSGGALAESNAHAELTNEQIDELVLRSYPYIAMFNVNNKFALDSNNPLNTGGYNSVFANTDLADHNLQAIARPNNDTLYTVAMIDVTEEPVVMTMPAFDSKYVSLMVTAYDHYVNIPMSTGQGDFAEPSRIVFYSERTPGYDGEKIDGVDMVFEVSGDFVGATLRVMPHMAEPDRLEANRDAKRSVSIKTLSEFMTNQRADSNSKQAAKDFTTIDIQSLEQEKARFPAFGSDFELFEDRFVEVMQFVVNHTTFDANDPNDNALLEALEVVGVAPGSTFSPDDAVQVDGEALRASAERFAKKSLAAITDADFLDQVATEIFLPKGNMDAELLAILSVVGPIGQPATEALYVPIATVDGQSMNASYDYEIVMPASAMPPADAFWSLTLYDEANGFFIPNDHFKYSVGENAGYNLDEDGGIRIVVSSERPEDVPAENWLPINRSDLNLSVMMRLYSPDLEGFSLWDAPIAQKLN